MEANRPWLVTDAIVILSSNHPLTKHSKKILPKFDPDNDVLLEDHIKHFMIYLRLLNLEHEDVVCRLFPYTFEGKASTWFFSLSQRYITCWKQFEAAFMTQFGVDKHKGYYYYSFQG
jgi:hypothetical protein